MKKIICVLLALSLIISFSACKNEKTEEETTALSHSETDAGMGLVLTGISAVSGPFPEDGSDTPKENMLCAGFRNNSGRAIEYAEICINLENTDYFFEITTLPPDGRIQVFEKFGRPCPQDTERITVKTLSAAYYEKPLSLYEDVFSVTMKDGSLTVKNISDKDIKGEIILCYKNIIDGIYIGGITYRLKIGGLSAGQEVSGFASHAKAKNSKVMFISYGE